MSGVASKKPRDALTIAQDPFSSPAPKRGKKDKKPKNDKKKKKGRGMLEVRSYYYRPASRGL
jgi:hypothetical protein